MDKEDKSEDTLLLEIIWKTDRTGNNFKMLFFAFLVLEFGVKNFSVKLKCQKWFKLDLYFYFLNFPAKI